MNLYDYLVMEKKYTDDEALETCLRLQAGMELPEEVHQDIRQYAIRDIEQTCKEILDGKAADRDPGDGKKKRQDLT